MRIAIYTAHAYQRDGDRVYADRAFVLFLGHLARSLEQVSLIGRLDPGCDRARYELSPAVDFVALHHYESLAHPLGASLAMLRSLRQVWRALDDVDAVWVLGPHPLGLPMIALAVLRGREVFLGVRQDTLEYTRTRHPGRRWLHWAGAILEGAWRALARFFPTIVVGPELAKQYRRSRRLHELTVSLVPSDRVLSPFEARDRAAPTSPVTLLSVGRLEEEKNPVMLAAVLAELVAGGGDWRLIVCGEGPLDDELRSRVGAAGLDGRADLRGYVPFEELLDMYRSADLLLATSWTEGFPQVFVEALAAGLPVVSTDVGGIRSAAGEAVTLVPAGDAQAMAAAARSLVADDGLRRRVLGAGLDWASRHTSEAEVERLAEFLEVEAR